MILILIGKKLIQMLTVLQIIDEAKRKMNDVILEIVDSAVKSGIKAKYVLWDSWYISPRMFSELL